MSIRLIAIDIDGTLLDSKFKVPEANRRAIAKAVSLGIEVALVTGRRFDFARPIAEEVGSPLTMIVNNGALVKSSDGVTRLRHLLPARTALEVLRATQSYRAGTGVVFDRPRSDQVIYEHVDWKDPKRGGYYERNREYIAEVAPLEACLTEDPIVVMYLGTVKMMREAEALLRGLLAARRRPWAILAGDHRVSGTGFRHAGCGASIGFERRDPWRMGGTPGFQRDETMAIGDNHNDREMLEFAGVPVVMANCVDELKTTGWRATLSNDEAGVAAAIETYALGGAR